MTTPRTQQDKPATPKRKPERFARWAIRPGVYGVEGVLALTVGKQLARRELRVDPTQVIAIIRESLAELPTATREIRVHLHPEDAAIVRERLTAPSNERAWSINARSFGDTCFRLGK